MFKGAFLFIAEVAEQSIARACRARGRKAYEGANPSLGTMLKDDIQKLLENEPLIINWQNFSQFKTGGGSLFFGIGLMSKDKLSVAMPFDILSFFFVSEILKRPLNLSGVNIIIADNHALSNGLFSKSKINDLANQTSNQINKIIRNFALKDFNVFKASEIHSLDSFQKILTNLPSMENEYLRLEIADTLWLVENKNLKVKLGWAISSEKQVGGNDERFFDKGILKTSPDIQLIHLQAGRTLNPIRPKASPYLSTDGEPRILLVKDENVEQKIKSTIGNWPDKSMGGLISHLHDIVRCFERLQGRLPFNSLGQKIQFIIDKAVL